MGSVIAGIEQEFAKINRGPNGLVDASARSSRRRTLAVREDAQRSYSPTHLGCLRESGASDLRVLDHS
jgi:hypothetical protein